MPDELDVDVIVATEIARVGTIPVEVLVIVVPALVKVNVSTWAPDVLEAEPMAGCMPVETEVTTLPSEV